MLLWSEASIHTDTLVYSVFVLYVDGLFWYQWRLQSSSGPRFKDFVSCCFVWSSSLLGQMFGFLLRIKLKVICCWNVTEWVPFAVWNMFIFLFFTLNLITHTFYYSECVLVTVKWKMDTFCNRTSNKSEFHKINKYMK